MAHAIKVRRSGIDRIFRKTPFRGWLDEQPRKALTYAPADEIRDRDKNGWTTEDFIRECWKRGLDVRIGTTNKWTSGSKPRPFFMHELEKAFPGIKF